MRRRIWLSLAIVGLLVGGGPLGADSLRDRLLEHLSPTGSPNPAVSRLLEDYVAYHQVFLVIGGTALVLFLVLTGFLFWHFSVLPSVRGRWGIRKSAALGLGLSSGLLSLGLGLVVFANATTVLDPNPGFRSSVSGLRAPAPGSPADGLHQAYRAWLESGSGEVPPAVQQAVDERLAWQGPKAWISLAFLVLSALASGLAWRGLGARFARVPWRWGLSSTGLLLVAFAGTLAIPVLLAMVIGNSQGALAPLALTLFFA